MEQLFKTRNSKAVAAVIRNSRLMFLRIFFAVAANAKKAFHLRI